MSYKHGTYQKEGATNFILPVILNYGYFIVGSAPLGRVKEENRSVNKLKRIANYEEAIKYFGDTQNMDFTISQAIKVFFELYGVAPLYVVNVLDPATDTKDVTLTGIDLVNNSYIIPSTSILPETLVVKDNATSLPIVGVVTELVAEGLKIYVTGTKVDLEYKELDPTKLTKADIIGGYDLTSMKRTGLELVNEIYMTFKELPAFIDAPGFTEDSEVATILETKARTISGGMFESIPLINAPANKRYDEIPKWKDDNNIVDSDQFLFYGHLKLGTNIYYQSIHYAALALLTDNGTSGVPCQTPSNKAYKMDALMWKNGTNWEELRLDRETQANFLNYNGVITAINFGGWRCWGSETAANPLVTDPKDKTIIARRMFKHIGNQFVISYFDKVDSLLTGRMARYLLDSMNSVLAGWKTAEYILGGEVFFSPTGNSLITAFDGDFAFDIELGIVPHMKSITFTKQINKSYLESFLNSLIGGN